MSGEPAAGRYWEKNGEKGVATKKLPLGWWLLVEETYCDKCGKMTPCYTYQGHFICNICKSLTGFWVPVVGRLAPADQTFRDIDGVKKWNAGATALVPVSFKLRGEK